MDLRYPIIIILCGWLMAGVVVKDDVGHIMCTEYALCSVPGPGDIINIVLNSRYTFACSLRRKVVMHARLKLGSVCRIVYVCSKHGKVQYLTRFIISDCVSVHVRYMITYTRGPHPSGFPDGLFPHGAASSFFSFCFFKTPPDESMKESTATVTSQKKITRFPSGGCGVPCSLNLLVPRDIL